MRFRIDPMEQAEAEEVATWRYPADYAFDNADADADDLAELLDGERRAQRYFTVRDEQASLVGFFQFKRPDMDTVEVGLGLRPDLTGRGLGETLVRAGLAFARRRYRPKQFRLAVAAFDRRAIPVYERCGLVEVRRYVHQTNGGEWPFEQPA